MTDLERLRRAAREGDEDARRECDQIVMRGGRRFRRHYNNGKPPFDSGAARDGTWSGYRGLFEAYRAGGLAHIAWLEPLE